jgi:hypothetical protein
MISSVGSVGYLTEFLPDYYVSSSNIRINVKELTAEQAQEVVKTANMFEQQLILQHLLIAGNKMETTEQRSLVRLAGELYIKMSDDIQKDFLMNLVQVHPMLKKFAKALYTNHIFHASLESEEEGSSRLSKKQLRKEEALARSFVTQNIILKNY